MQSRRRPIQLSLALVTCGVLGCLDLSPESYVFRDGGAGCHCELPAATCAGATRRAAVRAQCTSAGSCELELADTLCPQGCDGGLCIGAPCLGVVCESPPANECTSATVLRTYSPS